MSASASASFDLDAFLADQAEEVRRFGESLPPVPTLEELGLGPWEPLDLPPLPDTLP